MHYGKVVVQIPVPFNMMTLGQAKPLMAVTSYASRKIGAPISFSDQVVVPVQTTLLDALIPLIQGISII